VVLCSDQGGDFRLWWVEPEHPDRAPQPVDGAAATCDYPSAARYQTDAESRPSITVAYERRGFVLNLRMFDVPAPGGPLQTPERILPLTRRDSYARFSRHGSKLAFVSNRSGAVGNPDGQFIRQQSFAAHGLR
jgi:hypothetical protein